MTDFKAGVLYGNEQSEVARFSWKGTDFEISFLWEEFVAQRF